MGSRLSLFAVVQTFASLLNNGQSYEGNEGYGRHESHEGHEEEGDLRQAREAPCLRRQDQPDQDWAQEVRPHQEQGWQDREQEGEPQGQEVERFWPMALSSQEGTQGSEPQGLRRDQEGHPILQEGEGVLRLSTASDLEASS